MFSVQALRCGFFSYNKEDVQCILYNKGTLYNEGDGDVFCTTREMFSEQKMEIFLYKKEDIFCTTMKVFLYKKGNVF